VQAAKHNRPANLFLDARIDIRMNAARVAAITLLHIESAPEFAANAASRKRGSLPRMRQAASAVLSAHAC
jgi:hypothetical protein